MDRERPIGRAFFVSVFLIQLALFVTISRFRLVDGDEGFYLMSSRLAMQGRVPYHDFLLTQMPLLPYVYGAWMRLTGMTWISGRLLAALLAAALGAGLSHEAARQQGRRVTGIVAGVLFVCSTLVFAWFPVVKTYGLSALLIFLAYRLAVSPRPSTQTWVLAGVWLGLSADARLYFGGLFAVFLWWIWKTVATECRMAALKAFALGFAIALAPNLYLFARDPQRWYFDNIGFHAMRSSGGLVATIRAKGLIVSWLLLAGGDGNGAQLLLLLLATVLLVRRPGYVTAEARLALTIALVLSLLCLAPSPPFVQYFSVVVPFFALFVATGVSAWAAKSRIAARAGAAMLAVFVLIAVPSLNRFLITGFQVAGVPDPEFAGDWRIVSVRAVSKAIDMRTTPGEAVLSLWPGYLFESHATPVGGLESNAGTYLAGVLTGAQQEKFHILSPETIIAKIGAREPRLVVLGNYEYALRQHPPFREALVAAGYQIERQFGSATVWMRRE